MNVGKSNTEKSFLPIERAASKTARNFKSPFASEALPTAVCVNIDWLSMMTECLMPEQVADQQPIWHNDNLVLVPAGGGGQNFKYKWKVLEYGEHIANVLTHTRNEKIIKQGTAKLEVTNNVHYSTEIMPVVNKVMEACKMTVIKNITRIDIAIDGANHIPLFLNSYLKHRQNGGERVHRSGSAAFHGRMFDQKSATYKSFKIGSSRKQVVVYNKSQELEFSHKEYIRESWERSGLDLTKDVWRVELRCSSEAVKDIEGGFDLNKIHDPNYLLTYFRTQCKKFFEFVDMRGQTNVTYGTIIDILQFEKLRIPLLARVPKAVVDGAYKAKMSVHNAVKDLFYNLHSVKESINAALQHISDNIRIYNLDRWFEKKKPQWELMYAHHQAYHQGPETVNIRALLDRG